MLYLRKCLDYVCFLFIRFNGVARHLFVTLFSLPPIYPDIRPSSTADITSTWHVTRVHFTHWVVEYDDHNFHLMSSSCGVYFYSIIDVPPNLLTMAHE